jgi:hypothetical protein
MNSGLARRPSTTLLFATIALAAAGVIAIIALTIPAGPVDPETAALRSVTEAALRSLYDSDKPPATYNGGPLPSPIAAAMRIRVTTDISQYFTPSLQARYLPMILDAVDQIGKSEWNAQGDLRFEWAAASVDGDRAIVQVKEIGWVVRRGGQFGIGPTSSHRLDWSHDWTVNLVRSAGVWRVDGLDLHCQGGCG